MTKPPCPPPQDVARLIGDTERITANRLIERWNSRKTTWNYFPVNRAARPIIELAASEEQAASFANSGAPSGRLQNMDVAKCLFQEMGLSSLQTRRIDSVKLEFGDRDCKFGPIIRPACIIIENQAPKILHLLPRKTFGIEGLDQALLDWICTRAYATTRFAGLQNVYLDFSADATNERQTERVNGREIPKLQDEEALKKIQMFLRAFELALKEAPAKLFERPTREEVVNKTYSLFP